MTKNIGVKKSTYVDRTAHPTIKLLDITLTYLWASDGTLTQFTKHKVGGLYTLLFYDGDGDGAMLTIVKKNFFFAFFTCDHFVF